MKEKRAAVMNQCWMHMQKGKLIEPPICHLTPVHNWVCILLKIRCIMGRDTCSRKNEHRT